MRTARKYSTISPKNQMLRIGGDVVEHFEFIKGDEYPCRVYVCKLTKKIKVVLTKQGKFSIKAMSQNPFVICSTDMINDLGIDKSMRYTMISCGNHEFILRTQKGEIPDDVMRSSPTFKEVHKTSIEKNTERERVKVTEDIKKIIQNCVTFYGSQDRVEKELKMPKHSITQINTGRLKSIGSSVMDNLIKTHSTIYKWNKLGVKDIGSASKMKDVDLSFYEPPKMQEFNKVAESKPKPKVKPTGPLFNNGTSVQPKAKEEPKVEEQQPLQPRIGTSFGPYSKKALMALTNNQLEELRDKCDLILKLNALD